MQDAIELLECGHVESPHSSFTRGYGWMNDKRYCYECCARMDREYMLEHGKIDLYIDENNRVVTNWPGSLKFEIKALWHGDHNWYFVDKVTYVRFIGPDGKVWSGKHMGGFNTIVHCKRTKLIDCYV